MTGLYLALYLLALNTNTVLNKQCIENAGAVTFQESYDLLKSLPGMACNKHGDAMSVTCVNPEKQIVGRVILLKDKNECMTHPERELYNLNILMKKNNK